MSLSEEIQGKVGSVIPASIALAVALGIYVLCHFVNPGWVTWGISFVSLGVIIITALSRANDLHPSLRGLRWEVRRAGLILVSGGASAIILLGGFPQWRDTFLYLGFAMTWFTTPHMPPWWKYIAGKEQISVGQH